MKMNFSSQPLWPNDISRTLYSETAEDIFSSRTHGTFTQIGHMLGHKTNPNILKKDLNYTEMTSLNTMELHYISITYLEKNKYL